MELYFISFLVFAVPAHLVAGLIWFLGRREKMKWNLVEYLFLYLTWAMMIALALSVFGGLEQAAQEMGVDNAFLLGISAAAGICGGLSLLPRLLFSRHKVHKVLVTSISSFILATIFVKFVLLVFLFMPAPPAA